MKNDQSKSAGNHAVPSADATPLQPPYFAYSGHRGMRRVLLDLKDGDGREAFLTLASAADVVVESFRPGVVDRLGIGEPSLRGCPSRVPELPHPRRAEV